MNAYNQRQLKFMLERINSFECEQITLNKLIDDLEALYNLVELEQSWKQRFRSEWWELEQINAMQLYRQSVNSEDKFEIKDALQNLRKLIDEKVQSEEKQQTEQEKSDEDNQQKI